MTYRPLKIKHLLNPWRLIKELRRECAWREANMLDQAELINKLGAENADLKGKAKAAP